MSNKPDAHFLQSDLRGVVRLLVRSPDGITTAVLCIFFLLMWLFPSVVSQLGNIFYFKFAKGNTSNSFLLIPPMLFIAYVWLNAFTKTSKFGAYVNAVMIFVFAWLLFLGLIII